MSDDGCIHCQVGELVRARLDDEDDPLTMPQAINGVAQILSGMITLGRDEGADQISALRCLFRHLGVAEPRSSELAREVATGRPH